MPDSAWVDQTNAYIQEVDERRIQREEEKFLSQFREVLKRPAIPWMYGAECGSRPEPVGRARGRGGSSTQRGWGEGRKSAKTRAGRSTRRIATSTSREVNSARGEIEFPSSIPTHHRRNGKFPLQHSNSNLWFYCNYTIVSVWRTVAVA